jgi:hypothetical protein
MTPVGRQNFPRRSAARGLGRAARPRQASDGLCLMSQTAEMRIRTLDQADAEAYWD